MAPIHGVTFPTPAGGKYRQIMVDLDPAKLLAKGLTPSDVVNAVNAQNLTTRYPRSQMTLLRPFNAVKRMVLLGKVLPMQVSGEGGGPMEVKLVMYGGRN